jgi:hypothetical protein
MSYEESYAKAFPFDKMVDRMLNPPMIEDTICFILEGINRKERIIITIIIINRAGGNAPLIAKELTQKILAAQL